MTELAAIIAGLLVLVGSFFALVAVIGLWRLPDIYTRSHAASKTGTLGSGLVLIALAVHAGDAGTTSRALAGVVFFLLTAPIAAHLLARAAYSVGYPLTKDSVRDDLSDPR
ncbi:MAG: monovalent cation/H(+) antiporter subunit G [Phyllobacteriaceae bacterium]|jgi:multicomponent Na+:H+ antiporter subunit G|nr:monovalent cation/H(+) antiporter subunit G [Phyllobacteriaceae bacterium]